MISVTILDKKFKIDIDYIKYKDFLIKVNYNFNKNEKIKYDRDPDIFEKYVLSIAYQNHIDLSDIKLDNI